MNPLQLLGSLNVSWGNFCDAGVDYIYLSIYLYNPLLVLAIYVSKRTCIKHSGLSQLITDTPLFAVNCSLRLNNAIEQTRNRQLH